MQILLVVLDPGPAASGSLASRIAARVAVERPHLQMLRVADLVSNPLSELTATAMVIFLDAREGDGPANVAVEMLRSEAGPAPSTPEATPVTLLRQAAALGGAPSRAASVTLVAGPGEPAPPGASGDDDAVALAARCVLRLLEEWELELA